MSGISVTVPLRAVHSAVCKASRDNRAHCVKMQSRSNARVLIVSTCTPCYLTHEQMPARIRTT